MSYCRLCISSIINLEVFIIHNIQDKIKTVFPFEITSHPGLSEVICSGCVDTVSQFYDYFGLVQQNQLKLTEQAEKTSIKNENSTNEEFHAEESLLTVKKEVPFEPLEADFEEQHEKDAMKDDEFLQETEIDDDDWLPENEIKIEPNEVNFDDPIVSVKDQMSDKSWKVENNLICRPLEMTCDVCLEDQFSYTNLEAHLKKEHARGCFITCCGQMFTNEQLISSHLVSHCPAIKSKRAATSYYEHQKMNVFKTVLSDFKKDLEGYEPLPSMELALNNHITEKKKLIDVVDHLVQTYFTLDCELCDKKFDRLCERRKHFTRRHPKEKHFVSCCGSRFVDSCGKMRHLNHHWKRINNGNPYSVTPKQNVPTHNEQLLVMTQDFSDELAEGGFTPPINRKQNFTVDQIEYLRQMQDYLISKLIPLQCELCETELSNYPARRDHFRTSHPQCPLYVECCGVTLYKRFKIILHLQRHKKGLPTDKPLQAHSKNVSVQCVQNDVTIEHTVSHKTINKFNCDYCTETFSNRNNLKTHTIAAHAGEMDKIFKCQQCDESFSTKRTLQYHTYRHKLDKCKVCGVEIRRSYLLRHMQTVHKMGEELVCPECPKVFHNKTDFNAHHRKVHLNIRNKPLIQHGPEVICPICQKVLNTKQGLKSHHRIVHGGKSEEASGSKKEEPAVAAID